jgi:hypothetical protein
VTKPKWRTRAAGWAAHGAGSALRAAPGTLGALLVSYALWLAWEPLGYATAGVFLLIADRRIR